MGDLAKVLQPENNWLVSTDNGFHNTTVLIAQWVLVERIYIKHEVCRLHPKRDGRASSPTYGRSETQTRLEMWGRFSDGSKGQGGGLHARVLGGLIMRPGLWAQ